MTGQASQNIELIGMEIDETEDVGGRPGPRPVLHPRHECRDGSIATNDQHRES